MEELNEIKELIRDNKVGNALGKLYKITSADFRDFETPVVIIESEYRALKKDELSGILKDEQSSLILNRIKSNILTIINDINDQQNQKKISLDTKSNVILFLASTPVNDEIDIRKEMIEIDDHLKKYQARHNYKFEMRSNVKANELTDLLYDIENDPEFIHFSGHSVYEPIHPQYGTGILFEDNERDYFLMKGDELGNLISTWGEVKCVLLNACHSAPSGFELSKYIPYVISYRGYITDKSAIAFAVGFYKAIANKKSIEQAFRIGKFEMKTNGFVPSEAESIILFKSGDTCDIHDLWDGKSKKEWRSEIMFQYYEKKK